MKDLKFDAQEVKVEATNNGYVCLQIFTKYPEEVIENFTASEILEFIPAEKFLDEIDLGLIKEYFDLTEKSE